VHIIHLKFISVVLKRYMMMQIYLRTHHIIACAAYELLPLGNDLAGLSMCAPECTALINAIEHPKLEFIVRFLLLKHDIPVFESKDPIRLVK